MPTHRRSSMVGPIMPRTNWFRRRSFLRRRTKKSRIRSSQNKLERQPRRKRSPRRRKGRQRNSCVCWEFRNWTIPAPKNRNPKYQISLALETVQFAVSDFGFEVQESSNFEILTRVALGSAASAHSSSYTLPESSQTRTDVCFC